MYYLAYCWLDSNRSWVCYSEKFNMSGFTALLNISIVYA